MCSGGVSRAALRTRERHVTGLPAEGHPEPCCARRWHRDGTHTEGNSPLPRAQPSSPCAAALSSLLPWLGSPLHSTNPLTPRDFYLFFSSRTAALRSPAKATARRLHRDGSRMAAATQEHLPPGWGLLRAPQHSFQPTALHIKYHQIIYRRCQLQATAKGKVYLRYHVDCCTRS